MQITTSSTEVVNRATTDGNLLGQRPSDPIAFYGAAPVVQPAVSGSVTTVAAGSTTSVFVNTTFNGGVGPTAYTVGDIVVALKALGLLAQ